MARKGENIRKRKDGRWEGRFKNGFNSDGTTKYSSVYGKNYTEAKNKLTDAKKNTFNLSKANSGSTRFDDILTQWMNSNRVRLKGATENKYQYMIDKHIKPTLGSYKISRLTSEVINSFLGYKLKHGKLNGTGGLSSSYVKGMSVIIGSALKFAADEGLCSLSKISIHKPQETKKELQILSLTAQQKIEDLVSSDADETKIGILLALHAGLRIGEICALEWNDIDFSNSLIHVRHTITRVKCPDNNQKTHLVLDTPKTETSIRDIPITSVLLSVLKNSKQHSASNYVVSTNKQFVSTRTFDYRYRRALESMGVSIVNFHALRHTFATRCIEVGVDIKTLSELLGHSNVNITLSTYVHSSLELKRKQIEKICFISA